MDGLKEMVDVVLKVLNQEDKQEEALKVLEQIVVAVTLIRIGTESFGNLKDLFEKDDISQAEMMEILNKNTARLEAAHIRAKGV
jgi:hypothetical protein